MAPSSRNLFLLLGLLFAIALLISSADSEKTEKTDSVEEAKYGRPDGYGNSDASEPLQLKCPNGCCRTNRVFKCVRCCKSADESPETEAHEDDNVKN